MVRFATLLIILDMKLNNGDLEKSSSTEGVDKVSGTTVKLRPFGESVFVCNLWFVEVQYLKMDSNMEGMIYHIWEVNWALLMSWEGILLDPSTILLQELQMEMDITVPYYLFSKSKY